MAQQFRNPSHRSANLVLAILLVLGLMAVAGHFYWPVRVEIPQAKLGAPVEQAMIRSTWSLAEFEPIWNKQLLAPPPPAPPVENPVVEQPVKTPIQPVVVEPLPIKLAAILFSDDAKIAVFETVLGNTKEIVRLRTDESFQEVKVVSVTKDHVDVEFKGRAISMRVGD